MAIVRSFDKDKQDQTQPLTASAAPQAIGAGGVGQPSQESKVPQARQGAFTNLQKYLQANQPGQFGQQVAGKVTGETQKATGEVARQQEKFSSGLQQARTGLEQSKQLGSQLIGQAQQIGEGKFQDADVNKFQQFIGGTYGGPQGFEDPMKALAKARMAQQVGQMASAQGTAGKAQLLQGFYGRPTYSSGQINLDTLLLSQGAAPNQLRQAGLQSKGLEQKVLGQASSAEKQAALQKEADIAGRSATRGELQSSYDTGLSDVQARQQELTKAGQDYVADIQRRIGSGGWLTKGEGQALGLNPNELIGYGDINLGQAYGVDTASLGDIGRVATKEQAARMLGLAKLAGQVAPQIDASQFSLDKAGTAQTSRIDQGALQSIRQQMAGAQAADTARLTEARNQAADVKRRMDEFIKKGGKMTEPAGKKLQGELDQASAAYNQMERDIANKVRLATIV